MSRLFSQLIGLSGTRGESSPRVATSLSACVMDGSLDEPMDDGHSSTARRNLTVVVKSCDLGDIVPQIGDRIELADCQRFAVVGVQPFYESEFILDCRKC